MDTLEKLKTDNDFFYKAKNLTKVKVGDNVKVTIYLEIPKLEDPGSKEKQKERIQVYEGVVISCHGKKGQIDSTITVRKMFQGGGIEKVFLINSPWLKSIEVLRSAKVRRSKLYYLRERKGKSARLKRKF